MSDPLSPSLPPPLPRQPPVAVYATRNNALAAAYELRLEGEGEILRVVTAGAADRVLALADLVEVRLEYVPTRVELNRFRCVLVERSGRRLEFFNRRFTGFATFEQTDEAYVVFVRVLLLAIERYAPVCRCLAGAGGGSYALGVVGFVIAAGAVLLVAAFAVFSGLWWLLAIKAAVILFYLPTAWQWLRRNRERDFSPAAIPATMLPYVSA